jgi:hypothetical protein
MLDRVLALQQRPVAILDAGGDQAVGGEVSVGPGEP